ncbi:MAG: hypothetical protein QXG00_00615 [Candidatus Woesearchaeota archaeon]
MSIVVFSTVLIDSDHIFRYFFDKKEKRKLFTANYFEYLEKHTREKTQKLLIFHTFEFFILLWILSRYSQIFFYFFLGFFLHFITDLAPYYNHHRNLKKLNEWFFTWHIINFIKKYKLPKS